MKKLLFLLAFAMLFAFVACGDEEAQQQPPPPAPQSLEEGERQTVLSVSGMTCGRCSTAIIREVSAIDGVSDVSVDLDGGTVTVNHLPEVSVEEIKNAIVLEGFTVN